MSRPATAPVIEFRPRMGRPSQADELRLEFIAREAEEREMAQNLDPLIQRLRLMASGPVARATVDAIDLALARHARRWQPESPEAA